MGMGTEFVRNKDADRRLAARVTGADTGGYGLKEGVVPLSAGPGDVLYLKGHAYPGNEGNHVTVGSASVHRIERPSLTGAYYNERCCLRLPR